MVHFTSLMLSHGASSSEDYLPDVTLAGMNTSIYCWLRGLYPTRPREKSCNRSQFYLNDFETRSIVKWILFSRCEIGTYEYTIYCQQCIRIVQGHSRSLLICYIRITVFSSEVICWLLSMQWLVFGNGLCKLCRWRIVIFISRCRKPSIEHSK